MCEYGTIPLSFATDPGREFKGELTLVMQELSIADTAPDTVDQNAQALVESTNAIINDRLRVILLHTGAPSPFWPYAITELSLSPTSCAVATPSKRPNISIEALIWHWSPSHLAAALLLIYHVRNVNALELPRLKLVERFALYSASIDRLIRDPGGYSIAKTNCGRRQVL
jgi:hypothetical protein